MSGHWTVDGLTWASSMAPLDNGVARYPLPVSLMSSKSRPFAPAVEEPAWALQAKGRPVSLFATAERDVNLCRTCILLLS